MRPPWRERAKGATVAAVDLLVLAPWLVFGTGLWVLGYRLLTHRGGPRRHTR